LSPEEDLFVTSTARGQQSLLALSLLVLMFRRLGRFVALHEVPLPVIDHVRRGLRLAPPVEPIVGESTLYRHHRLVREFLQVRSWDAQTRRGASGARVGMVMNNPADLVNVAIEALVRERSAVPELQSEAELQHLTGPATDPRYVRNVQQTEPSQIAPRR
jgi:Domain of unknown function (DUF4158)